MSGMLTVVGNPRRRRHSRRRRRVGRVKSHRRRRSLVAINPRHRRRRVRRHRAYARRSNPRRRRRFTNPIMSGGMVGVLVKGLTAGVGAIAARIVSNGINNAFFKGAPLAGPAKIGLEAGVGLAGYLGLKAMRQQQLASMFAVGAGIAIVFDIYDLYIKGMLPANLQDYGYGTLQGWAPQLNGYEQGTLQGWAPQATLQGDELYSEGIYS